MGSDIEIPIDLGDYAEQLHDVVHSELPANEFWERLLESYSTLCGATQAILLVRRADAENSSWRKAAYREAKAKALPLEKFQRSAIKTAESTLADPGNPFALESSGRSLIGVRLRLLTNENTCVAVFLLSDVDEPSLRMIAGRLQLVSTAPSVYQLQQNIRSSRADADKFANVLEMLVPINEEDRFLAASLALCNAVATALACERVSLGWWERGFIRLKAISRMEKFNRAMAAAQDLETAMDEALEQDVEVSWPAVDASVIARDHEKFCQTHQAGHMISLPLRSHHEAVAVLTCERQEKAFTPLEITQLRLLCDLATPRMADLKEHDRWFGAKWATGAQRRFASLVGPTHTWAKILALFMAALLAVLIFVKVDYRVEGDFILRSDEVIYLTAPFDGFIEQVHYEAPQTVKQGEVLLTLQTEELILEEAAELANVSAYARQAERARALNQLADMRIAEAQVKQAEARLAIVRDRLAHAEIRAPFNAVIIEGDLRELRGKPIEKGSPLYKLAQLDKLCVEAKIDERDVHEVEASERGEIAFVSQPKYKYPITVTNLEPAAFPEEKGNIFQMRCDFIKPPESWWRPGMTGVCKLEAGKRSLMWIAGHRTVDFFRLWLWW